MISMNIDMSEFNALIKDLGEGIEDAIRPAAQAGAQVIYDQVKVNVNSIGVKSGNLRKAIYQAYDTKESTDLKKIYGISWNKKTAPHGQLLEFGHIQRYSSYVGKDGKWHTAIRPDKRGTKKPSRRASQAEKDAYYVLRPGGSVQWMGKSFLRGALDKSGAAQEAIKTEFFKRLNIK